MISALSDSGGVTAGVDMDSVPLPESSPAGLWSPSSSFRSNESKSPTGMASDLSIQQVADAKETFSDLEVAYRKFKDELESVKEGHKAEVCIYV